MGFTRAKIGNYMAEILLTDLTNGDTVKIDGVRVWEGTGVFDVLMNAVNKNLDLQYQNQRINGNQFAEVYASSIVAVLQQSITFVLQDAMTDAQLASIEADTALKVKQLEALTADINLKVKQLELADAELIGMGIDNTLKTKQVEALEADIDLKIKQLEIANAELADLAVATTLKQEQVKLAYTTRVKEDKAVALLRLDDVVKTANTSPESIYTPKYEG